MTITNRKELIEERIKNYRDESVPPGLLEMTRREFEDALDWLDAHDFGVVSLEPDEATLVVARSRFARSDYRMGPAVKAANEAGNLLKRRDGLTMEETFARMTDEEVFALGPVTPNPRQKT